MDIWGFDRRHSGQAVHSTFDSITEEEEEELLDYQDRRPSMSFHPFKWIGVSCFLIGLATVGYMGLRLLEGGVGPKMVYFQVKALDQKGYPVAGAAVFLDGDKIGVTDAFGEWFFYHSMIPKDKSEIRLEKTVASKRLFGGRIFTIEPDAEEPIEVKFVVRLTAGEALKRVKAFHESTKNKPSRVMESFSSINVELVKPIKELSGSGAYYYARLRDKSFPALKRRLTEAGVSLKKHSDMRMKLDYIASSGSSGFLRVKGSYLLNDEMQRFHFLRRFSESARLTARDILDVYRAYIPGPIKIYKEQGHWFVLQDLERGSFWRIGGEDILSNGLSLFPLQAHSESGRFELLNEKGQRPCSGRGNECDIFLSTLEDRPPRTGWQKMELQVTPVPKRTNLEVYVSGFMAKAQRPGIYEFWGESGKSANVTILNGSKIKARQRLRLEAGSPNLVIVPGPQLALSKSNMRH